MIVRNDEICAVCGRYTGEGNGMVCEQCIQDGQRLTDETSNNKIRYVHIENSYNVWLPSTMQGWTYTACFEQTGYCPPDQYLNRSWRSIYIEWYLHNIGYWITLPFVKNAKIKHINERCKHVDLEEHQ